MMTEVPQPSRKGFLIVAILSAAMSSVSSALTSLSSVSTMDFIRAPAPRAERGVLPPVQQALDCPVGRRAHRRGVRQPPRRVCLERGLFVARSDQRRIARRPGIGRGLAQRPGRARGRRDVGLSGGPRRHPGAGPVARNFRSGDEDRRHRGLRPGDTLIGAAITVTVAALVRKALASFTAQGSGRI